MTRNQSNERNAFRRGLVDLNERRERVRVSPCARAAIATLVLGLAFTVGCRSLFIRDEQAARFEPEQGRYVDGSDASQDWASARENARGTSRTLRRESNVAQRDERSTTRGAAPRRSEEVNSDAFADRTTSPSWSQRLKNALTPSFLSGSETVESEFDDDLVRSNPYNRAWVRPAVAQRESRSVEDATSDAYQSEKKPGFWSKLFGGGNDEKVEAKEYPGAYMTREETPGHMATERVVKSSPAPANNESFMTRFGKKRTKRVEPWNRSDAPITQFEKSDYMPPIALIQQYYSQRDMAPRQYADLRNDSRQYYGVERPSRDYYERVERTAMNRRAYRSRSYAPSRASDDDLPVSPRRRYDEEGEYDEYDEYDDDPKTRLGAASLSPIPRTSGQIAQASSRSNQRGTTRPAHAVALTSKSVSNYPGSHIAQASYDNSANVTYADYAEVDPDALFGWNEENALTLSSFQTPRTTQTENGGDYDGNFKDELGKRNRFEWFDQSRVQSENAYEQDAAVRPELSTANATDNAVDDALNSVALEERKPGSNDWVEATVGNESKLAADEFPSLLPNLGAPDSTATSFTVSNAIQEDALGQELSYEDELDGIVDMAITDPVYASDGMVETPREQSKENVTTSEAPDKTLSALSALLAAPSPGASPTTSATDLAAAVAESVDSEVGVAPSSLASSDPNEELRQKATELNASSLAPESLEARKGDAVAAPLTAEEIAWVEQVKSAIQSLLREREEHKRQGDDVRICDARLRLLFLVIGEYERSIQEIQDDSDPLKTFWEKECRGLETLLQNQLEEIDPTFVAERLRSGLDSFSGFCKLQIRKALLVSSPACYGLFEERVEPYRRHETVYAYAELDYVTSVEMERGYSINVECRWRLLDSAGAEVVPFETQRCVNLSETKLRDVVLNVSVPLPATLRSGAYQLELDVVDLNAENPTSSVKRLPLRVADTETNGDFH